MCGCASVCVCVATEGEGKGSGQVNELVIRIDIASAVGFPPNYFHPSLPLVPLSFWSSVHPLNSLCHLHTPPPLVLLLSSSFSLDNPLLYLPGYGPLLSNLLLPLSSNAHQALLFCPHHHLFCFMHLSLFFFLLILPVPLHHPFHSLSSFFSLLLMRYWSLGYCWGLHSLCRCYCKTWHSWTFERDVLQSPEVPTLEDFGTSQCRAIWMIGCYCCASVHDLEVL